MQSSTPLKGKISLIYKALLEDHSSPLTALKKIWQKGLGIELSDDQWDNMCKMLLFHCHVTKQSNRIIDSCIGCTSFHFV